MTSVGYVQSNAVMGHMVDSPTVPIQPVSITRNADGMIFYLPQHARLDINPKTLEKIVHTIRACPDEYE